MQEVKVSDIRKRYPDPKTTEDLKTLSRYNCYCVGGALILYMISIKEGNVLTRNRFPNKYRLAKALRLANDSLYYEESKAFALKIISNNDSGAFEEAWNVLEEALNFK